MIRIPCDVIARLQNACATDKSETREWTRCVNITQTGSSLVVVATNGKILACEYINKCDTIFPSVSVYPDKDFKRAKNGHLVIADGAAFIENPFKIVATGEQWPDYWLQRVKDARQGPTENYPLSLEGDRIQQLASTTVRGTLIFPTRTGDEVPVIVRTTLDSEGNLDENWFGLFLTLKSTQDGLHKPATVPDWI